MVMRYKFNDVVSPGMYPERDGNYVKYEDYKELEAELNDILDMLVKLDNDLGYGVIPDEYAYDRVGDILEKYRNEPCN